MGRQLLILNKFVFFQGSAVFWFNFDNDLNPDGNTLHAGCPVIIGSKWIANKWIYIRNQELMCDSQ